MSIIPFLKWAGGKRWLISAKKDMFNFSYKRYFEPFIGGGSVFFHINPSDSILSDKNEDLINSYIAIKNNWKLVYFNLITHGINHSFEYFYEIRNKEYVDIYERAARFIYLNRTCWNGLYRVNKKGKFNVPKGTKDMVLLGSDDFYTISNRLQKSEIINSDFEKTINMSKEKDFIFADPPYTANHNKNGFLKYNENIFSWSDQIRLSETIKKAKERGVKIIMTNADHESVRELYDDCFNCESIERYSVLSGKPENRGKITELLITANI